MVRVMAAVMTGVIMAGRTGAAFAAQLGTMQVNEEIDALRTFGDVTPVSIARASHGNAILGSYTSAGGGTVVTTGCTDWTYGLRANDPDVEQVTRNILTRLAGAR